jgi:hypothetical protein
VANVAQDKQGLTNEIKKLDVEVDELDLED